MRKVIIVAALVACMVQGAEAHHRMGESHPRGYGVDPCVTVLHDMATAQEVYTDAQFSAGIRNVGCREVNYQAIPAKGGCYKRAVRWLARGNEILDFRGCHA